MESMAHTGITILGTPWVTVASICTRQMQNGCFIGLLWERWSISTI